MKTREQHIVSVKSRLYASTADAEVWAFQLANGNIRIDITNLGCSIVSVETPDKDGVLKNIVSGYPDLLDYSANCNYFGSVVGRYANRIAGGRFQLDGQDFYLSVNNGGNHLHGGFVGFNKKIWNIHSIISEDTRAGVVFEYLSRDGEEGYAGNLQVKLTYLLNDKNQLSVQYEAETDAPTPVNFTNHSYFNLAGFEQPTILDHLLQVNARYYTEKNQQNIPTGRILPVADTALDFRTPEKIGKSIDQFPLDFGYDHNFVLESDSATEPAAILYEPWSGRSLTVYTTQPGIQVYTANYWDGSIWGPQGLPYVKHGAVALETQAFPDSPNQASFPNTILRPGEKYRSTSIYEFGLKQNQTSKLNNGK